MLAVTVQEYLSTVYEHECEYLDGVVVERTGGELDHSRMQGAVAAWLFHRRREFGISVLIAQRVQVAPARYRAPDVCVSLGRPDEQIFTEPPFICIEILSPDDRLSALQQRVDDYLNMGVNYVWVLDPKTRAAYHWTVDGMARITELRTGNPDIHIALADLFDD